MGCDRLVCGLLMAAAVVVMPAVAFAQSQETTTDSVFTPTLFLLASRSNNEYRTVGQPVGDASLYTELELPFVFRGPRWNGDRKSVV